MYCRPGRSLAGTPGRRGRTSPGLAVGWPATVGRLDRREPRRTPRGRRCDGRAPASQSGQAYFGQFKSLPCDVPLQAYSELSSKRGISQITRVNRDLPWSRIVERTNCYAFQCAYCRHSGCGRNRDVGSAISCIYIHYDQARRTSSYFWVRVRYQLDARSQRHSVGLISRCTST